MLQAYLLTGIWSCSGDAFGPLLALGGPDPLAEPTRELANAETFVRNSCTMPFRGLRRLKVTATSKACGMAYALKAARKVLPIPNETEEPLEPGSFSASEGKPFDAVVACRLLAPTPCAGTVHVPVRAT
jgi:hypothetical protein